MISSPRGVGAPRRLLSAIAALALILAFAGSARAAGPGGAVVEPGPKPQLILIHGGSFLYGDPTFEPLTRARAVAAGFVPHYLHYPLGNMPAAYRAARAEAFHLRAKVGSAVYAYGSSAGGTLAALLAGDGLVSAAVAKAPVSDLATWEWPLSAIGADYFEQIGLASPEARRRLSPLARPARRPLLILQGRHDQIVPLAMNRAYAFKFKRVHLWVVRGGHHTERLRPDFVSRVFGWLARVAAPAPARHN